MGSDTPLMFIHSKAARLMRRILRGSVLLALTGVALLLSSGCRNEPSGTIQPDFRAPYLLSLQVAHTQLDLDTSAAPAVVRNTDGSYTVTDSVFATVVDPTDGANIRSCTYRLSAPGSSSTLQTADLSLTDVAGNVVHAAGTVSFTIRRGDIGRYTVQVTATGAANASSNAQLASIVISRRDARPQISNLLAPDTLHRPSTGFQLVRIALTANDSDGLADIEKVFFKSINSQAPDFEQPLFDDGALALDGDSVANDGRYARLLTLDSTATLGTKEFRFWARDKSGVLSDSLIHFIVIEP